MAQDSTPGVRTMFAAEWQRSVALWRADGATDAEIDAMSVGCPRHGSASMDYDGEPFCTACDCERVRAGRVAAEPADAVADLLGRAYRLGSIDAYAGRRALDLADDDSAGLMTALGQTEPTTAANAPLREALGERYYDGYCDAAAALR